VNPAYVGEYRFTVDPQGRVTLPTKLLKLLGQETNSSLMAMKWFENCIALMPAATWETYRPHFADDLYQRDRAARFFKRSAFRGMDFVVPDNQGRILLNKDLRAHAGIESDVVIYGVGDWIECWSAKKFDEYMQGGAKFYGDQEELANKYLKRTERPSQDNASDNTTR
jgi:MraZ protein